MTPKNIRVDLNQDCLFSQKKRFNQMFSNYTVHVKSHIQYNVIIYYIKTDFILLFLLHTRE